VIVLDEAGFNLAMARTHGRAPPGQRCVAHAPVNYGPNVTVIGALAYDGVVAALAFDGATDVPAFETFIERVLAPRLRPGHVVVLDNLSVHKATSIRVAVEARGARLQFLPPYSPDFSPIEPMWSKVKTLVRGVAERTRDGLIPAIGRALDRVSRDDARNWFRHCGYRCPTFT
jgi:transposase